MQWGIPSVNEVTSNFSYAFQVGFSVTFNSAADDSSNADTVRVARLWNRSTETSCIPNNVSIVGRSIGALASFVTMAKLLSSANLTLRRGQLFAWDSK